MEQVNIHYAKTNLSRLVKQAAGGEPFIIARNGHPLVSVRAVSPVEPDGRIGFLKGQIEVPDDFDRMGQTEIGELFG